MADSPLKIGFVFDDSLDKTDGIQQYVLSLGAWLGSQGHEVHYLVGETRRRDMPRVHSLSKNVAVRFNGNRLSMPLPAPKDALKALLLEEQFDVLHVQMPYSPWLAGHVIRAAQPQTAIVGTFHVAPNSKLMTLGTLLLGAWVRRSLKRFDAVVSVSTAAQTFARQTFGIDTPILPNVVDYEYFHAAEPFKEYKDGIKTVLFLGRLVQRKGCRLLLEAVKLLAESGEVPAFRVLICGKGPLEGSLKAYVRANRLGQWVTFTGFVSEADKPRYYASADIAVFPSRGGESFGIVLLEAMASGNAAVLAGSNSGYASVMGKGSDLLFNPLDASELAAKLKLLLSDEQRRRSAASWGSKHAQDFDTGKVGTRLEAIYKQALRSRRNMR
ncbi:MAG TPA: glycosyltransferase family 4 protein [Patescibacteria group bacterium]|nr:glycosyltransferase family 4 protein [Patescibacteria group bacterium]